VIGASHMSRISSILAAQGHDVCDLAEKSWVLSDTTAEKIINRLREVSFDSGTVVVIDPLGNSATKYRQADDTLALAQKLRGGGISQAKL
jgi:hypothetical protein